VLQNKYTIEGIKSTFIIEVFYLSIDSGRNEEKTEFGIQLMLAVFQSRSLLICYQKNFKIRIYMTVIFPVVLYGI
jgi:hypothetical protein